MKKPKGSRRPAGPSKTTRRQPEPKSIESQSAPIPDVPSELWALIASFSSRQTLARLCLLSRSFYAIFLPNLYSNVLEPPLNAKQSSALLETLRREPSSSSTLHHPASLIRKLRVKDDGSELKSAKSRESIVQALNNLRLLPMSNQRGPSLLRVLHWGMTAGINDLGRTLGSPGNFPHLRELVITSSKPNHNVNFVQIPGLEVLGCNLICVDSDADPYEHYTDTKKLCYKLSEALQMLPFSSPHLHTLQLKICFDYYEEAFPEEAYLDLIATVNLIRLPDLRSLNLAITCYRYDGHCYHSEVHPADVSHFLAAHPMIVDLSFEGCGLAPIPKTTAQSLTKLHSFTGSFEHSTILSAENSNIQRVVLIFKREFDCDQKGVIEAIPPIPLRSVTRVTICAVDEHENALKYPYEMNSQFYWRLVSSFQNITHLDVVLGQRVKHFQEIIMSLGKLQYLRLHEYRVHFIRNKTSPREEYFAAGYTLQLNSILPSLLQLDEVVICLLADFCDLGYDDSDDESEDNSYDEYVLYEYSLENNDPEAKFIYHFSVARNSGQAHVILTNTEIFNPYKPSS